jgi:hypothetical protein
MKKANKSRKIKPSALADVRFWNGWLSPTGVFYNCGTWEHSTKARKLAGQEVKKYKGYYDGEQALEKLGWLKVSGGRWYSSNIRPMSQKQMDFVFDWCVAQKKMFPPDGIKFVIEAMEKGYL